MSIEERVAQLRAEIEARHGQSELLFVSVVCDRCGTFREAPSTNALLPLIEGWRLGRYGESADFCPECR